MIRMLAVALVVVCAGSALAGQGNSKGLWPYVYRTEDEKLIGRGAFVPQSRSLKDALGGWNRGDPNDPYWDPCISYQRSWGTGGCGGH
jgi:hypothetical protein